MKKEKYNVAVVGATGAVGNEMVSTLEERNFPVAQLKLLSSKRGAGTEIEFKGKGYTAEVLDENSFKGIDIGLFSAGGSVSEKFAPIAGKAGCVVIDNTSAWRMDPEVPLVVPEVNAHAIGRYPKKNIIANPNCSTIQMVVALKPIHDAARIKRIVVSTYQAVSGTGKRAIKELESQVLAIYNQQEIKKEVIPTRLPSIVFLTSTSSSIMDTPKRR
jgi:aspartate-semialdehyde dehydrogenase